MKYIEAPKMERPEWLQWRHQGIGSSDAPAIIGKSRYKTADELLIEKIHRTPEDSSNEYIKNRGNKVETRVRAYMEQLHNTTYAPINCENNEHSFLRASLDGLSTEKFLEIKLLSSTSYGKKINTEAAGYVKWTKAREKGIIPIDYYPQIQHQLMVTGLKECIFVGLKEVRGTDVVKEADLAIVKVVRDEDYIDMLRELEIRFWIKVLTGREKFGTLDQSLTGEAV